MFRTLICPSSGACDYNNVINITSDIKLVSNSSTINFYELHLCVHNSQSFLVILSKSWVSKQLCLID